MVYICEDMTMKRFCYAIFMLVVTSVCAQPYNSYNIDLLAVIDPDTVGAQTENQYSGCWGWYQASKNKEYAISGGRNGTWFIDVTNPATPSVCAFVPGVSKNCTWRELKTYDHYCYIVSDACQPNAFQIVDLQYLPDSVKVVHSDTTYFVLGHTIWIDQDKMYVGITNFKNGFSPMTVWSLANPEDPQLYARLEHDDQNVAEVHDMYVRNDTVYASIGWQGLRVYKLQHSDSSFVQLGSYSNYSSGSYNHSSFLMPDGEHLVFCDEVPGGMPANLVNVKNLQNIQPVVTWHPEKLTTPHNPYIMPSEHLVLSSYKDGLFIYDLKNIPSVGICGFFDTYPGGGHNTGDYGGSAYGGNWGAYPYLPSGIIIANDMRNGVFVLDPTDAYAVNNPVTVSENGRGAGFGVYPVPADNEIRIVSGDDPSQATVMNLLGETVLSTPMTGKNQTLQVSGLEAGTYIIQLQTSSGTVSKKIIISR